MTHRHSSEQCTRCGAEVVLECELLAWSNNGTNTTNTMRMITIDTGMQDGRHQMLLFLFLKQTDDIRTLISN